MRKRVIIILLFVTLVYQNARAQSRMYYIAPNGKSTNPGTISKPFRSLTDAQNAIRKNRNASPNKTTIYLRGGIYELPESFRLTEKDSGSIEAPVVYSAYRNEKVLITGGKKIAPANVKNISAAVSKHIILQSAVKHLKEIDLNAAGITDYGTINITGFRRPYVNAPMELFIKGRPYHLARFPDTTNIKIHKEDVIDPGFVQEDSFYSGKIKYDKERMAKWSLSDNIMLHGNFKFAWATDQLRVAKIEKNTGIIHFKDEHMWGFTGEYDWNQYFFFNVLEELDHPGEYYVDDKRGKLYFYPYEEIKKTDTILVSILEDALVTLKGASNVHFKNIQFEAGRGIGIYMENTNNVKIENCIIKNMGVVGVCMGKGSEAGKIYKHPHEQHLYYPDKKLSERLGSLHELMYENTVFDRDAGFRNGVINCKIENTGKGGISMGGGNRKTLEPGENYVYNTEFTNCGRLDYSYKSPVNIDGVGNKIQHCQFHQCPATAIYIHGNDHLIEYNFINEACHFVDDQGAIYIGRDPSEFGNIIRYNYFKNIGNFGLTMAVYYDDGACGTQLYGNVFYNAGSATIMIGGGSYNPVFNNIFIKSPLAISLDDRLQTFAAPKMVPGGIFELRMKAVDFAKPPYSIRYPQLAGFYANNAVIPKGNDIVNNVFVNVEKIYTGDASWGPVLKNYITKTDPGFVNFDQQDFTLKQNAVVFDSLPQFKPIPFSSIGLIK